jgi:methanogenic corrinoid protein MtbC1
LYSERDIHVIKWLMSRQTEGLSISRAVERWNDLISSGSDPLNEAGTAVIAAPAFPARAQSKIDALRAQWLRACTAYDEVSAEHVLNEAFAMYATETVVTDLMQAAMHDIGEMWHRGEASVQQEHFMSSLCMRRLDALIEATPPPVQPEVVVLACPESEVHVLPIQFLHLLLRRVGRRVVFLGADVPMAQLGSTVQDVKPALVVMTAQQLTTASTLRDAAALLQKMHVPTAFGGRVFDILPELREAIAGSFLGGEIKGAAAAIDDLLRHADSPGRRSRPGRASEAQLFREMQAKIESNVEKHFAQSSMPSRQLATANRFLGAGLGAALDFGNVRYLEADIEWVRVLLRGQGFPEAGLRGYLLAYAHGVRRVLRGEAGEIAGWLESYAGRL